MIIRRPAGVETDEKKRISAGPPVLKRMSNEGFAEVFVTAGKPAGGRINEYPHSVYPIDRNGYGL